MEELEIKIAELIYTNVNAGHRGKTARLMAQEIISLIKEQAHSSVSSSAGLEGLLEWAIKEREKLEAYTERNGSRYLDPSTWGQIDMIVKVENKIAELKKVN